MMMTETVITVDVEQAVITVAVSFYNCYNCCPIRTCIRLSAVRPDSSIGITTLTRRLVSESEPL